MHQLLLESADDGLDGRQFLLVLVDPVRAAGSGPEINLFDEVSLLTLELRQKSVVVTWLWQVKQAISTNGHSIFIGLKQ